MKRSKIFWITVYVIIYLASILVHFNTGRDTHYYLNTVSFFTLVACCGVLVFVLAPGLIDIIDDFNDFLDGNQKT